MHEHALHIVDAAHDLRIAMGRLRDVFSVGSAPSKMRTVGAALLIHGP